MPHSYLGRVTMAGQLGYGAQLLESGKTCNLLPHWQVVLGLGATALGADGGGTTE